jgi:hypothetical protein
MHLRVSPTESDGRYPTPLTANFEITLLRASIVRVLPSNPPSIVRVRVDSMTRKEWVTVAEALS